MILLDTHALIWVLDDAPRLGRRAAQIANRALPTDRLWTSAISFWEISLLVTRGRLRLTTSPEQFRSRVQGFGVLEAPLGGDVALEAATLASLLKDPADCFVAATARLHHATLMTADDRLIGSGVVDTVDARR